MSHATAVLPEATHIGRTALRVGDLDELAGFYRDVVGLDVLDRAASETTLGAGGTPLLVLYGDPDANARHRSGTGLYHNAFRVPTRAALGDALGRIRDGWQIDGASDHLVSEALYLTDPEGNGIEVYRDRPMSEWPRAETGTVRMDTRPLDLPSLAREARDEPTAPAGTSVGHVHLEVSSIGAAREFYVDTLGFGVSAAYGPSSLFLAAGDYHHHVGLNTWHRRTLPLDGRGLAWFEVVVPDAEAVAGARERFERHGVAVTDYSDCIEVTDRTDGIAGTDPDGIRVRIRSAATEGMA